MVRAQDGVDIYFDPCTIQSTALLGYTDKKLPVYRIIYNNGYAEDMVDVYNALMRR